MPSCLAVALSAPPAVFWSSPRWSLSPARLLHRPDWRPCGTCRQLSTWSDHELTDSSCSRRAAASCSPGRAGLHRVRAGPAGYVAAGGEPYIASRPPGACRTPGAPSSETMSSHSMPTRRRARRIRRTGQELDWSTSPLTPSPPVSPSTSSAGSAIASSSRRLSPARPLSTRSTASAAVGWWRDAPRVEGGLAVAPSSFGRFDWRSHRPRRHSGRIFAFRSTGAVQLVADLRVAAGADIGVEGVGFVPSGFSRTGADLLRSRSPGSRRGNRQPAGAARNRSRARGRPSRRPPCSDRGGGDNDLVPLRTPLHRASHRRRPRGNPRRGAHHFRTRIVTTLRGAGYPDEPAHPRHGSPLRRPVRTGSRLSS